MQRFDVFGFRRRFLKNGTRNFGSTQLYLSLICIGLVWIVTSGYAVLRNQLNTIVSSLFVRDKSVGFISVTSSSTGLSLLEKVFIGLTIVIVCLVALIGFLQYIHKDKWNLQYVLLSVFFAIIAALSFSMIGLNPNIAAFAVRTPTFLFIFLAPLFGYSAVTLISRGKNKKTKLSILLLLICFSTCMLDLMPRDTYYYSNEKDTRQLWEVRQDGQVLYSSMLWYASYVPISNIAIGDAPIYLIGTGMLNLSVAEYSDLYNSPQSIDANLGQLKLMNANYVFVDNLMSYYTEQWTYQIFSPPISPSNLQFLLNNCSSFDVIYNNGLVQNLYLTNQTVESARTP